MAPLETAVRVTPSARRAEEWATVLAASGIGHRLVPTGWAVVVAGDDAVSAGAALAAWEEENGPDVRAAAPAVGREAIGLGVAVAALLLGFFVLTGPRQTGVTWFERGSVSAARILHGELWRTVTALTLHADLAQRIDGMNARRWAPRLSPPALRHNLPDSDAGRRGAEAAGGLSRRLSHLRVAGPPTRIESPRPRAEGHDECEPIELPRMIVHDEEAAEGLPGEPERIAGEQERRQPGASHGSR